MCEKAASAVIHLGVNRSEKSRVVRDFANGRRTVVVGPSKFWFPASEVVQEFVDWPQIIKYKTFYRLLQEIDANTVVVLNECLRTQQRSDLTLNCIRHYLSKTRNVIVFQWLPIIDTSSDIMTLVDFVTQSRFKGRSWEPAMRETFELSAINRTPRFEPLDIKVTKKTKLAYEAKKKRMFDEIGIKDPHTIPRNLLLLAGKEKASAFGDIPLVGRNNRYKLGKMASYKDNAIEGHRTVFEPCHNFIDMVDFLTLTEQTDVPFIRSDLPVDRWYFERYKEWSQRIDDAYAAILG